MQIIGRVITADLFSWLPPHMATLCWLCVPTINLSFRHSPPSPLSPHILVTLLPFPFWSKNDINIYCY